MYERLGEHVSYYRESSREKWNQVHHFLHSQKRASCSKSVDILQQLDREFCYKIAWYFGCIINTIMVLNFHNIFCSDVNTWILNTTICI